MSEIILPSGLKLPGILKQVEKPAEKDTDEKKATMLPTPTGWKLLCAVPDVEQTFSNSGILKADSYMRTEEHGTTVLFVLKAGPDAYGDKTKFPAGPWCKEGDFILVRTYSGTRFKIHGKEFRLLNDDQVDAVVVDPRGITRC
jgi:co-chaperonin GroES (HSP10)